MTIIRNLTEINIWALTPASMVIGNYYVATDSKLVFKVNINKQIEDSTLPEQLVEYTGLVIYPIPISNYNKHIITVTENCTINFPTELEVGMTGTIVIKQDSLGGHSVIIDSSYTLIKTFNPIVDISILADEYTVLRYEVILDGVVTIYGDYKGGI